MPINSFIIWNGTYRNRSSDKFHSNLRPFQSQINFSPYSVRCVCLRSIFYYYCDRAKKKFCVAQDRMRWQFERNWISNEAILIANPHETFVFMQSDVSFQCDTHVLHAIIMRMILIVIITRNCDDTRISCGYAKWRCSICSFSIPAFIVSEKSRTMQPEKIGLVSEWLCACPMSVLYAVRVVGFAI